MEEKIKVSHFMGVAGAMDKVRDNLCTEVRRVLSNHMRTTIIVMAVGGALEIPMLGSVIKVLPVVRSGSAEFTIDVPSGLPHDVFFPIKKAVENVGRILQGGMPIP